MATLAQIEDKNLVVLEPSTGEVRKFIKTKKVTMEEFIMVFVSFFPEVADLSGKDLKVLMYCWRLSKLYSHTDKGNTLINDSILKEQIKELNPKLSDSAIDASISRLAKRGLLFKQCKGHYILNYNYFFKGSLTDRSNLRLCLEVEPVKEQKKDKKSFCFMIVGCHLYEEKKN